MHLEHLNLVVSNMKQTLKFYQVAFPHWKIRNRGVSTWYGVEREWLHFGDDYQYLTFNDNGTGKMRDLETNDLGMAHFAFVTNNISAVIKRLTEAGYPIKTEGAENEHRKNIYFLDPNGYEVEFVEYLSDIPIERNSD